MQPFARGTKGMGFASVESESETVSCFSMSMAESRVSAAGLYGMCCCFSGHVEGVMRTVAKFVQDDGNLLPVLLGQDVVQKRGFAGPEISRDYCHGHFAVGRGVVGCSDPSGSLAMLIRGRFGVW